MSDAPTRLTGLLCEYDSPTALREAAAQLQQAGLRDWETYTPFAVPGIEPAGPRAGATGWLAFGGGAVGLGAAMWLQWWTNAVDYPWLVSGKPLWSVPATIPAAFAVTILFAALAAVAWLLLRGGLLRFADPLDRCEAFQRASDHRFCLFIRGSDPEFDETRARELLAPTSPVAIEAVTDAPRTGQRWGQVVNVTLALIVVIGLAALPFRSIARARAAYSTEPRIHLVHDMDVHPSRRAQSESAAFFDRQAMRLPVEGTVARGELRADEHLYEGQVGGVFASEFPPSALPTPERLARGLERYAIECAHCHGAEGKGDGPVQQRAAELAQESWVPPTNLHYDYIRAQPVGQIFHSITSGIRTMTVHGRHVPVEDVWAVVAHLKHLHTQHPPAVIEVSDDDL